MNDSTSITAAFYPGNRSCISMEFDNAGLLYSPWPKLANHAYALISLSGVHVGNHLAVSNNTRIELAFNS